MTEPARTLVADPPWRFGDSLPGNGRGAAKHYQTMAVEDIYIMPLPFIADDSRLFLWRVASMQEEAIEVTKAWGFTIKSEIVWIKMSKTGAVHMGMGRQVRNSHEVCLIATRGKPERLRADVVSFFFSPRGRHSAKPEEFYRIVERLSPGPYAELFARRTRPGWDTYGNEVEPVEGPLFNTPSAT